MIYVPRMVIDLLRHPTAFGHNNPCVCTKIEFRGFEISVSSDSSHGSGDLWRTDIRVFTNPGNVPGVDCTTVFLEEDETMLYGNAETLLRIMKKIEMISKETQSSKEQQ